MRWTLLGGVSDIELLLTCLWSLGESWMTYSSEKRVGGTRQRPRWRSGLKCSWWVIRFLVASDESCCTGKAGWVLCTQFLDDFIHLSNGFLQLRPKRKFMETAGTRSLYVFPYRGPKIKAKAHTDGAVLVEFHWALAYDLFGRCGIWQQELCKYYLLHLYSSHVRDSVAVISAKLFAILLCGRL